MADTLEIDARPVPGNGGSVVWLLADDEHRIVVRDTDGEFLSIRAFHDGALAADAYWHPFADSRVAVPEAFTRKVAA